MTHRIIIVGGGAGGLELATRLGKTLGKRGTASITLVDTNLTHIWKPPSARSGCRVAELF